MSKLERRDFIKKTVMGGIGVTLLNGNISANIKPEMNDAAPELKKANHGPSKKIIVGGAGLAGLCCAYELMKKGHDVTVLEASGRHGGHIFTVHDGLSDGLYGDFGQEHIVKPGYKLYFEYAKELGVETIPYPRRKGIQRRINGKFYSEEMLKDPAILKKFGFNEREVKYLSENAWGEMQTLYTAPYTLLSVGCAAIATFFIFRFVNIYGDASHWSIQKNTFFSLLSFLNVTKYPPSLLYILITLGPAMIFLSLAEKPLNRLTEKIAVFGRVPFFYYVIHRFLIHLLAMIGAIISGYNWTDMILSTSVNRVVTLKGYGFNLSIVYIVWILLVLFLYPCCKWFDRYKRTRQSNKRWLTYL